jgi:hypothetical protein
MKIRKKLIFLGILVLIGIYCIAYAFILTKGKAIIQKNLENLTHKKVTIGFFDITFPLNLEIKNINIEGAGKIEKIMLSPSLLSLITGSVGLNSLRIIKPEITYEKEPTPFYPESMSAAPFAQKQKRKPLRLILKHINIKDGKINFIDHTAGEEIIKILIKDINFNLTNLYLFPASVIANFELEGKIPWQQGQEVGKIEADGWINFFKKDMQATLKIQDIDGIYLYPYYSQWIDLGKAGIENATLNFTSNINGLNNNITAECHLELTKIVRKERPLEELSKEEKITETILDFFKTLSQGKIVLDFTIRTKMDRPEFGFSDIKMAFEDKLAKAKVNNGFKVQDILNLPSNILQRTIKGATDFSKAVIAGTLAVGNELKKAVQDSFKKAPKE